MYISKYLYLFKITHKDEKNNAYDIKAVDNTVMLLMEIKTYTYIYNKITYIVVK